MRLPIANCQLPIGELFPSGGFSRTGHDRSEFIRFGQKRRKLAGRHDSRFDEQLNPQSTLVRFFFDGSNFGNEFSATSCATTCSIIRSDGCAASQNLATEHAPGFVVFGYRSCHFHNSQGKGLCSDFKFAWVHVAKLRTQSAIGNRQSAIL
jgi:hypothetical protein